MALGLAAFYRLGDTEPFDDADTDAAGELASRAALCLDNARMYTRERIVARIAQRDLPDGPEDDSLMLLARTRTLGPCHLASWTPAHDPLSASEARQLIADRLTCWGLGDLVFSAELIVSELVTNAVRYAEGTIGVRLIRDDSVVLDVLRRPTTCGAATDESPCTSLGTSLCRCPSVAHRPRGRRPDAGGDHVRTE
ncbi:hypothetical protein ACGFYV_05970 [Streptomyces sp. NPDC048297]|uniref:hypothetical protein n=1 Tax=Streptomyces sp. NPDC048297 TaxID=3365531 RepID=UPI00371CADA4